MRKVLGNILLLFLLIFVIVLYHQYYSVSGNAWSMQCTFKDFTGFNCPGCGGQRAFHYLLHGEILQALRSNLLIVIILPMLAYCYVMLGQIYLAGNKKLAEKLDLKPWHAYLFLILLGLFFILRNIPIYPFILLSPA